MAPDRPLVRVWPSRQTADGRFWIISSIEQLPPVDFDPQLPNSQRTLARR